MVVLINKETEDDTLEKVKMALHYKRLFLALIDAVLEKTYCDAQCGKNSISFGLVNVHPDY